MTAGAFAAKHIERMAESLAHFVGSTPEERLTWRPTLDGAAPTRSIMEQVGECAAVNRLIAAILHGEQVSSADRFPAPAFTNGEEARETIIASGAELAAVVREMTDADMTRLYDHPRGKFPGDHLVVNAFRNMAYHAGQANFIQVLYGDGEFHIPATWR